ncbi:MAG: hypothetical protein ABF240_05170, partial [Flavobacteriales bacterium]
MSDTELHKFAQILSVRLNSLTDKKALHIYRTLIPSDSFRNNVPLLYLDYINLNGRYLQVLSLVEELGANPSDLFFVDLMKFYNQFYTQKNIDVPHPSKPSQFDQFYSV